MDNNQFPPIPSTETTQPTAPQQSGGPTPVMPRPLSPTAPTPLSPAPQPVPPQPQPIPPNSAVPPANPNTAPTMPPPPAPMASKPKRKLPRIIAVIIVLLLLAGGGAFAFKYFQKPAVAPADENLVQQIPEASDEAMVVDEMSEWETYLGNGFSFKYPPSMEELAQTEAGVSGPQNTNSQFIVTIADSSTMRLGTDAPFDGFTVYAVENYEESNFLEFIQSELSAFEESPRAKPSGGIQQAGILVAGQSGVSLQTEDDIKLFYIPIPNKKSVIVLSRTNQSAAFISIFDQILSTFEFVETDISTVGWRSHTVEDVGLNFSAPPDLEVTTEVEKNSETNVPYSLALSIQNNSLSVEDYYQLYVIAQWEPKHTETELEQLKVDLIPESIQNIQLAGYPAVKGQVQGQRNRFVTYFIKDGALYSAFTAEPTKKNEALSNQILSTFTFTR